MPADLPITPSSGVRRPSPRKIILGRPIAVVAMPGVARVERMAPRRGADAAGAVLCHFMADSALEAVRD